MSALIRLCPDIYTVDEQLMMALRSYLSTVMAVFSTIVVVSVVTPVFTLCLIPIIIYYGYQQSFFTVSVWQFLPTHFITVAHLILSIRNR